MMTKNQINECEQLEMITIEQLKKIETNMAYRWFLGFCFHTVVPYFSTFWKNYVRRFLDKDIFEQIFYHILKEIMDRGLLSEEQIFIYLQK